MRRPGSSVGIATDYGLDGPGIEPRWGRDFPPVKTGPGAHPASCTMGTGSFTGVKCGRGVLLTTHPLLAPRSWKGRAISLLPLWAATRPVTGLLYFTEQGTYFIATAIDLGYWLLFAASLPGVIMIEGLHVSSASFTPHGGRSVHAMREEMERMFSDSVSSHIFFRHLHEPATSYL